MSRQGAVSPRKDVVESYFEGFPVACDVFTFGGEKIARVESYLVPLE